MNIERNMQSYEILSPSSIKIETNVPTIIGIETIDIYYEIHHTPIY